MTTASLPPAARLQPAEVLAHAGSNFAAGFLCLAAERRAGMTAIYAFCRAADDAVDDAPDPATARAHLEYWRAELRAAAVGAATSAVGQSLQLAMQQHGDFAAPLHALLDGMAMDIEPLGCADEAELRAYCWRVAAAVGHACLPVLGARGDLAERFADALGLALQLTNILRDLRSDAQVRRCYVPRDWLQQAGVTLADLAGDGSPAAYLPNGPVDQICRRLAQAARREFAAATEALAAMPLRMRRALVPARIMGAVYRRLLVGLERRGGELRAPRVRVSPATKMLLALAVLAGVHA